MPNLTPEQVSQYRRDGFLIVPRVFTPQECQGWIDHFMAIHDGRIINAGFKDRDPNDWGRWHNAHFHEDVALQLLIHPKLRQLLVDATGGPADGIQTMYFWKGSEQPRHQDQYYLPACFSTWIALQDVGPENGTIWVQVGSHRKRLLAREDFKQPNGELMPMFGKHYDDAVDAQFAANGLPEMPVVAKQGDVVIFDGVLIHRGGPVGVPGSFRHVMANHYVPHAYAGLNYEGYPRIAFDGTRRLTIKQPA
jgi:hypothetical protein